MTKIDHAKIIADWKAAYAEANPLLDTPVVHYINGWFHVKTNGFNDVYRAAKMLAMTAVLNQRVRNKELDKV